jgi:lipopolysaccharide transport system ATP-binding protein
MSSENTVIQVEGVGKCFSIYDRPQDRLKQFLMPKIRALAGQAQPNYYREFWALRDVSFEVGRGQAVGIIGRNGGGKSTLLQIITGTMTPTYGSVVTQGRTAALLELGSGFNPEFTGRENVYLNGSLLGLTHAQIDDRFDYIAGFADIGDHLDQPVKTYSSGMMLRLAFAVQVAVETEILIIDEALAVGDARFQLKCFRRLEEIKARGTTILFVSHATDLVRSFCDLGLVLENGKAIYWGNAKEATVKYFSVLFGEENLTAPVTVVEPNQEPTITRNVEETVPEKKRGYCLTLVPPYQGDSFGPGGAQLDQLEITGLNQPNIVIAGDQLSIRCAFSWDIDVVRSLIIKDGYINNLGISIAIADKKGNYIFGCNGFDYNFQVDGLNNGCDCVEFTLAWPCLMEGDYFMTVAIPLGNLKHHTQLKWYDYLLELKCVKSEKNVFGLIGMEYQMKRCN